MGTNGRPDLSPDTNSPVKLVFIKLIHTLVWFFFVGCIVGIPLASWQGNYALAAWLAAFVLVEVLILALNHWRCPLTSIAARYTDDRQENFDIFLPLWLARYNKQIFGPLFVCGCVFALLQWLLSG